MGFERRSMLHISVSSLGDFMTCRRLYFYKRIRRYERNLYNKAFIVGRIVHMGLGYLLGKPKDKEGVLLNPIELMRKYFYEEKKKANNEFVLDEKQTKELNEQEYITIGMLTAYAKKYVALLRSATVIGTEVEGALQFGDNVTFVLKLDNLLRIREKKILHELKTSKSITPDYVQMIRTDTQTAAYYHGYNNIFPDSKIDEIMYDVIKKPGIRQKKGESYQAFLQRLSEWYDKPGGEEAAFHIERFKKPVISENDIFNTIFKVSDDMLRSRTKEDYYQDFAKCSSYYGDRCPMYELCHEGGETKENLVLYTIRKSYHVDKSNKALKG